MANSPVWPGLGIKKNYEILYIQIPGEQEFDDLFLNMDYPLILKI
jgi:hypothetical protein